MVEEFLKRSKETQIVLPNYPPSSLKTDKRSLSNALLLDRLAPSEDGLLERMLLEMLAKLILFVSFFKNVFNVFALSLPGRIGDKILNSSPSRLLKKAWRLPKTAALHRSEEHASELQSLR